jgi:DNA invertase Pin-like site-specific DNA recombinase
MVRFVRENNIKIILVQEIDRLHRNKKDEATIDELIDEGVVFHLVGDKKLIDKNGENDIFMRDIEGAVGRREVRQMVKRTTRAKRKRLEDGQWVCQSPLGFINLAPSKHTKERYKKIEEVAEKVKKILEMYSTARYTVQELCDIARKMGLVSKQKGQIRYSAMKYILVNKFYAGLWEYRDKEGKLLYSGVAEGQWKPIVNKSIIEKNIKILNDQMAPSKKRRGYDFRFKGLMVCSNCKRSMIGEVGGLTAWKLKDGKNKSYAKTYYHCHRSPYKNNKGEMVKCGAPFFPEDFVEDQILWNLGLLEFDKKVWAETKAKLFDFEAKDILSTEQEVLRSERTKLERRLEYLLDQKLDPKKEIEEDYYFSQKAEWEKRLYEIRADLDGVDMQLDNWNENVNRMIELVDNLKSFESKWLKLTPKKEDSKKIQEQKKEKQRHMLQLVTKRIIAESYTGPLTKSKLKGKKRPVVNKKDSMSLAFLWSEDFQILFEMGFIKKVDKLSHVDKRTYPPGLGVDKTKKKRKIKLSTIQQKLDFLFSIIYLLFII